MTTSEPGPQSPYPALAEGLRVAAANAALLWQTGAQAVAAQTAAIRRLPVPDPGPGIDSYFELLLQATEANRRLAGEWAVAVRAMGQVLTRAGAVSQDAVSEDAPTRNEADGGGADTPAAGPSADISGPSSDLMVPEPAAPVVAAADGEGPAPDSDPLRTDVPGGSVLAPSSPPPPARTRRRRSAAATLPRAGQPPARAGDADTAADPGTEPSGPADDTGADPRAAYVRMGKAAISARLAERGLPRTGTLAQLVNRLVAAEAAD